MNETLKDLLERTSRIMSTVERGIALIFDPRVSERLLDRVDSHTLAQSSLGFDPYFGEPGHFDDDSLPVALVETSVAHVDLSMTQLHLLHSELLTDGCATTAGRAAAEKARLLVAKTVRHSLALLGLSQVLRSRALIAAQAQSIEVPWNARWELATLELGEAQRRLMGAAARISACGNPFDIDDRDLPLYFGDTGGVSSKYFAASDYILAEALALVNTLEADTDSVRGAWEATRDREIQQENTEAQIEYEYEIRADGVRDRYGQSIASACGLEDEQSTLLDRFAAADAMGSETAWNSGREQVTERQAQFARVDDELGLSAAKLDPQACHLVATPECEQLRLQLTEAVEPPTDVCSDRAVLPLGRIRTMIATAMVAPFVEFTQELTIGPDYGTATYSLATMPVWYEDAVDVDLCQGAVVGHDALVRALCRLDLGRHAEALSTDTVPLGLGHDLTAVEACGSQITIASEDFSLDELTSLFDKHGRLLAHNRLVAQRTEVAAYDGWAIILLDTDAAIDQFDRRLALLDNIAHDSALLDLYDPSGVQDVVDAYTAGDVAACYRGDIGLKSIAILAELQNVRRAHVSMILDEKSMNFAAARCIRDGEFNEIRLEATKAYNEVVSSLSDLRGALGAVGGAIDGALAGGARGGLGGAVGGALLGGALANTQARLAQRAQEFDQEYREFMTVIQNQQDMLDCWAGVEDSRERVESQIENVFAAVLRASGAIADRENLQRELRNNIREGRLALGRVERRAFTTLTHHFWFDEKLERYHRHFKRAHRLTYLAVRALEYDLQQSLALRSAVMGARTAAQLREQVDALEAMKSSRRVNGGIPDENKYVMSVGEYVTPEPDHVLAPDASTLADHLRVAKTVRAERLRAQLLDPSAALFEQGRYVGQALPISLLPKGQLLDRCAERVWGISAWVDGSFYGYEDVEIPITLRKQNTFMSQSCETDGAFYTSTLRPGADLLAPDPAGYAVVGEEDAYTTASLQAAIARHVGRPDFEAYGYDVGDSEELKARGLYGRYLLVLPNYLLETPGFDIDGVKDIVLRFEYLSVAK
jgi:hypothetical protein